MTPRSELEGLVPDMPYRCQDHSCACHEGPVWPWEETVHITRGPEGYEAEIRDEDGALMDVFRDHDLSILVETIHRNYPHARKK